MISTVSRRSLAQYHRTAYAHDNIVVAVAGNVTHERVLELLSARLPKTETPARRARKPFSRAPAPGYRFQRKSTEQYHVCLGAPGISRRDERRFAASLLDSILGGSASSRLFQEIREKRGMAYSVYSFASQYSDSGQVGLYVGTREENLVECLEIVARELGDVSAGNVRPGELERAKENLKGRMLLSMESTSNRMSRLGKSLITDTELLSLEEIVERIDAVTRRRRRVGRGGPARLDRLSAAGNRPERGTLPRRGPARQPGARRAQGRLMKVFLLGRDGQGRDGARPGARGRRATSSSSPRPARTPPSTSRARTRSWTTCAPASRRGCPASSARAGFDQERVAELAREHELAVFYAPNFALGAVLMMRFAAEAGKVMPAAAIVELHHETKLDAPSGTAKATAALLPDGTPIHSVRLPGLVAHQEVIFGGPGQTLTIRHDTTSREAFVPGVLLALEQLPSLPPGADGRARRAALSGPPTPQRNPPPPQGWLGRSADRPRPPM